GAGAPVLEAKLNGIRERTARPFGVNFLIPLLDRDCVRLAAGRAKVCDFFWGEPDRTLVDLVHSAGALASWQVGSLREALAARDAGCDFIIAQGIEAGGHIRGKIGVLALLSEVLDAVDIPVLAAGGIGSGRSLAAVLAAGAAGARVGTRFIATSESAAHPSYIAALVAARAEDSIRSTLHSVDCPLCPSTHGTLASAFNAAGRLAAPAPRTSRQSPCPPAQWPARPSETSWRRRSWAGGRRAVVPSPAPAACLSASCSP